MRTAEERIQKAEWLQESAQSVFNMLTAGDISTEQGRVALELLQLSADALEFEESVGRKLEASTKRASQPVRSA
jgi:hypothetical protein